jgi:hypothetical protein
MGLRIPGEIILTPWFGNLAQVIPRCPSQESEARKIHDRFERRRNRNLQSCSPQAVRRQRRKSQRCSHHVPPGSRSIHDWLRSTRRDVVGFNNRRDQCDSGLSNELFLCTNFLFIAFEAFQNGEPALIVF